MSPVGDLALLAVAGHGHRQSSGIHTVRVSKEYRFGTRKSVYGYKRIDEYNLECEPSIPCPLICPFFIPTTMHTFLNVRPIVELLSFFPPVRTVARYRS